MALERKWPSHFLLYAIAGALAIALAWPLDGRVDAALNASGKPALVHFAQLCSKLGEGWAPALAGIFFTILFALLRRPVVAAKILFVTLTCEFAGLVAIIARMFAGRTRPSATVPQGFYGVWHNGHWLIGNHEFASFPSGHSATAAGLAAAAWLMHRGWGAVVALYALMVMWSRIALGAHHFSDVVASTVLAIPLAMLSRKVLLPALEFQFVQMLTANKHPNSNIQAPENIQ